MPDEPRSEDRLVISTIGSGSRIAPMSLGIAGAVLCSIGGARFISIPERMSTVPSGMLIFATGLYLCLIAAILMVRRWNGSERGLHTPWVALGLGVPACLFLATAIEYSFIPFPAGNGANPGFWDSKLDDMIDQDGRAASTLYALMFSAALSLSLFVWIRPLLIGRHSATSPELSP